MDLRTALLVSLLALGWIAPSPADALGATPAPMLAIDFRGAADLRAYLVSEKLDGVRARWDGRRLWSRHGQPIDAPTWFTAGWPKRAMDGELWIARGRFQQVSDVVRALERRDADWKGMRFMAFDLPADAAGFATRASRLDALVASSGAPTLGAIPQRRIGSRAALDARLRAVAAAGGEGLMLHRADARYRAGRSDDLLKYKPFADAEARVVGYRPGKGKYLGKVGALLVEDAHGRRFALGSGLTDRERARPPSTGTWVTYRYNGLTAKGTPRFARFLRVRHDHRPMRAR